MKFRIRFGERWAPPEKWRVVEAVHCKEAAQKAVSLLRPGAVRRYARSYTVRTLALRVTREDWAQIRQGGEVVAVHVETFKLICYE